MKPIQRSQNGVQNLVNNDRILRQQKPRLNKTQLVQFASATASDNTSPNPPPSTQWGDGLGNHWADGAGNHWIAG